MFGAEISESMHSEHDTSSSSAHLNSFVNSNRTFMSITGSDITVGIDSDIFLESAIARECVDAGHLLDDSMEEIALPYNSTPDKVEGLSSIHDETTQIEVTHLHENWNKSPDLLDSKSLQENAISLTDDANEISITVRAENSMPLLEQIPLISADIRTPNLSQVNDLEIDWTKQEFSTMDIGSGSKEKDVEGILVGVGYSPSVVENILSSIKNKKDQKQVESRPLTQIFTQGKVYTYPKLETSENGKIDKVYSRRNTAMSSVNRGNLSLSYPKLGHKISTLDPKAVSFELREIVKRNPIQPNHDALTVLKNIRIDNLKNIIIGQLNINSLRNKHHALVELLRGNLDVLVITETKLDNTFPEKQFYIPGYKKPFRKDRNKNGGGVMIYVREDIPSDILVKHSIEENIEAIFVEINLRKNKLLLVGTYHSTNAKYGTTDEEYFKQIGLALDVYSSTYDKFLLAGDFNVKEENDTLDEFLEDYHAKNLVKDPTCFKNAENPSCIDLFITNSFQSFQKTTTVTTGLSDFHNMTVTVLKTTFPKATPRIISYRSPYEVEDLEKPLIENLIKTKSYESFESIWL